MSDYEQHIGRAKLIRASADEDYFKKLAEENGETMSSYHEDWEEIIKSELHEKYIVVGDKVYEITEKKELDGCDDIVHAEKIGEDEFFYVLRFYNGGTCESECLVEAIEKATEGK